MKKIILVLSLLCFVLGGCGGGQGDSDTKAPKKIQSMLDKINKQEPYLSDADKETKIAMDNDKVGAINYKGEVVVDFRYDELFRISDTEYMAFLNGGYHYVRNNEIDVNYQELIDSLETNYEYYYFMNVVNIWVVYSNGKYVALDLEGHPLIQDSFDSVGLFNFGGDWYRAYATNMFVTYKETAVGFDCEAYNLSGDKIFPYSLRTVMGNDGWYCPIDAFYNAQNEAELLKVENGIGTDVYDIYGNALLEGVYYAEFSPYEQCPIGYYEVKNGEAMCMMLDGSSKSANFTLSYDGDYTIMWKNGYYGAINAEGKGVIEFTYDELFFVYGAKTGKIEYFNAIKDGKRMLLNMKGKVVFEHNFDYLMYIPDLGLWAATTIGNKMYLLDSDGKLVHDMSFDSMEVGGVYTFFNGNSFQVYNKEMELIYEGSEGFGWELTMGNLPYFAIVEGETRSLYNDQGDFIGKLVYANESFVIYNDVNGVLTLGNETDIIEIEDFELDWDVLRDIQGVTGIYVKMDGEIHYVDTNLKSQYSVDADGISYGGHIRLDEDTIVCYLIVTKGGKSALMLESGEMISEYLYDDFMYMNGYGFIAARVGDTWGVLNYRGKEVTEFKYDFFLATITPTYFFIGEWYLGGWTENDYSGTYYDTTYYRQ